MRPEVLTEPGETAILPELDEQCTHYWIIDPPEGPFSKGVCKMCGAEKEFKNYVFYSTWDNEPSPLSGLGIAFEGESDGEAAGEFVFVEKKRKGLTHGQ